MRTPAASLPRRLLCCLLAALLAFGLSTLASALPALAAGTGTTAAEDAGAASAETGAQADIDELLCAGDYVEGEAIAIVRADVTVDRAASEATLSQAALCAEDLLASGEVLTSTSLATAQAALDADLAPAEELAADAAGLAAVQADAANDDAVQVVFVSDTGMSTRELLGALIDDPRVVCAEPNYVCSVQDVMADAASSDEDAQLSALADEASGDTASDDGSNATAAEETDAQADLAGNAQALTPAVQNGGFAFDTATGTYDLTPLQWAYDEDSAGFRRPDSTASDTDMGIPNWNDRSAQNAAGTVVAIMDTGVDFTNPDLAGVAISGENARISQECGGGAYGYNPVPDGDASDCADYVGHGTHCAGIVAAEWNGSGTSGAAGGAQLLGVRVFGKDAADEQMRDIVKGFDYLCTCRNAGMNLVAVNCSWGYDLCNKSVLNLCVQKLGEAGAITVSAAGNSSMNNDIHASTTTALANNPYSVTVSAAQNGDAKAPYSSYGQMTGNVFGAGSEIVSTFSSTGTLFVYGPADDAPAYRNYFENADLASHLWVSDQTRDATGQIVYPSTVEDLGAFSAGVSWSDEASVDVAEGSGSLALTGNGMRWLALPVKAEDVSDLRYVSIHGYGQTVAGTTYRAASYAPVLQDASGTPYIGSFEGAAASGAWSHASKDLLAGASEGSSLYTIPTDSADTVLVLFQLVVANATVEAPIYLDALTLLKADAATGSARQWLLLQGTSMATPSVCGCAAIVAASADAAAAGDTPADTARFVANYLKGHVRAIEGSEETCTQGGIVDLSVPDGQETPVVNAAKQDADAGAADDDDAAATAARTATLTGAYFGATPGTVAIGGTTAPVLHWSDDRIQVQIPDGLEAGEQLVEVTGANGHSGRFMMLVSAAGASGADGTQAIVFPETLSTPNQSAEIREEVLGLFTGESSAKKGLASSSLAVCGSKIYLSARDALTERYSKLYCYDPGTDTWSCAMSFADEQSDAWTYCSIAAHDGRIWCYGAKSAYGASGVQANFTPVMVAFDPDDGTAETIDASALGSGENATFVNATLAEYDSDLVLVGGMRGNARQTVMDTDNLATVQIENGKLVCASTGTLCSMGEEGSSSFAGALGAQVVEHDGALYVGSFLTGTFMRGSYTTTTLRPALVRVTRDADGAWTSENLADALPDMLWTSDMTTETGYQALFSLAAFDGAVAISGANVAARAADADATDAGTAEADAAAADLSSATARSAFDTYVLADGADTFATYPYTADLGSLFYPVSVVADGYLYTLGSTKYDEGTGDDYIFRRVRVEAEPEPVPSPAPSSANTPSGTAKTGDPAAALAAFILAILCLAGCAAWRARTQAVRPLQGATAPETVTRITEAARRRAK